MITVTRGADVAFSTSFTNSLGQPFEPPSATVILSYSRNGIPAMATSDMSYNATDGKWRASWSTRIADPGQVDWFIDTGGLVDAADQGSFLIVANTANLIQAS